MARAPALSRIGPLAGLTAAGAIVAAVLAGPGQSRTLRLVGGGIGLGALVLTFLPIAHLVRHGAPEESGSYLDTTMLVERGAFSLVRHPQYLAYVLFMCAFALLAQSLAVTLLAAGAGVLLYVSAVLEERDCVEKWGAAYRDYARRVPRMNLLLGLIRRLRRGG
jgi:protein-S-isoprenylcysteine O-methyltransferase Ste14